MYRLHVQHSTHNTVCTAHMYNTVHTVQYVQISCTMQYTQYGMYRSHVQHSTHSTVCTDHTYNTVYSVQYVQITGHLVFVLLSCMRINMTTEFTKERNTQKLYMPSDISNIQLT